MSQVQSTPDRTPEGWGSVAAAYDADIAPTMAGYAEEALAATRLQKGERVLDVAAGSGALSLQAARHGAQVVAIDFAPGMIERLQQHADKGGLDIDARVMDGQDLDLPDGTFDAVYSNLGLMFFPSPDQGLAEMHRVLREGGRAGIVTWNVPERSETFAAMFGALKDAVPDLPPPPQPPAVFSLSDPEDLQARMERAGFKEVSVRQVVRMWTEATPEAMWDGLTRSNPVMPGILRQVGPEKAAAVRDAFIARIEPKMQDGQVALTGEVHLATGHV